MNKRYLAYLLLIVLTFVSTTYAAWWWAHSFNIYFLLIPVLLVAAKLWSLVEKIWQPSVLWELLIWVVLWNLALLWLHFFNFTSLTSDSIIVFLAELWVVILLFEIWLESNIAKMKEVWVQALLVAIVWVIAPFVLGYFATKMLMPWMDNNLYLFIWATLTATSVWITARVFKDLWKLSSKESQTVLWAAVIDDVMWLIILAIVSSIVKQWTVSVWEVLFITWKAVAFLWGSIFLWQLLAPQISKILSKINTWVWMKFTLIIVFCLIFSFLAWEIWLAPIVWAFAAWLILDPVHFKYFKDPKIVNDIRKVSDDFTKEQKWKLETVIQWHANRHIEDLIRPISFLLVPIFFVYTWINVDLKVFADFEIVKLALILTIVAFVGKLLSWFVTKWMNKWIVWFAMVPRWEVWLIFAMAWMWLGVIDEKTFAIIVIVVILTTLLTPPIISHLLKKQQ